MTSLMVRETTAGRSHSPCVKHAGHSMTTLCRWTRDGILDRDLWRVQGRQNAALSYPLRDMSGVHLKHACL